MSGEFGGKSKEGRPLQTPNSMPQINPPRMIAWEITGVCNLKCAHCRASASDKCEGKELSTEECFVLIDDIASFARPIIIMTGGEPLMRGDIFEIIAYAKEQGLRVVMAPNGTLITSEMAERIAQAGVPRISVSIDSSDPRIHDEFRGVKGAFADALKGIENAKLAGVEFQINTTITKRNLSELEEILKLAESLGAVAHHIFLLVPTGRGKDLEGEEITPEEYEEVLNWFYAKKDKTPLELKATCAPHFARIIDQHGGCEEKAPSGHPGLSSRNQGCLGGRSFCFISRLGQVQPCGYLDIDCGNVRDKSFKEIWENSEVFVDLRNPAKLKGKCAACAWRVSCGGCRARAYAKTGDYLTEEPYCVYVPKGKAE
ncbi:MAG: heme b synthase [Actinomycetota bacterium]|nr:heme b synthase [Actinomycetota bacterium]